MFWRYWATWLSCVCKSSTVRIAAGSSSSWVDAFAGGDFVLQTVGLTAQAGQLADQRIRKGAGSDTQHSVYLGLELRCFEVHDVVQHLVNRADQVGGGLIGPLKRHQVGHFLVNGHAADGIALTLERGLDRLLIAELGVDRVEGGAQVRSQWRRNSRKRSGCRGWLGWCWPIGPAPARPGCRPPPRPRRWPAGWRDRSPGWC